MHIKNLERKHVIAGAVTLAILVTIAAAILVPRLPTFALQAPSVYHVDTNAPPDGDGSFEAPWNTIAPNVSHLTAGDVMLIHPGTYDEQKISLSQSGAAGEPITIRAYDGNARPLIISNSSVGIAISLYQAHYWVLDGLIVDRLGAAGMAIEFKQSNHNILRNCQVRNGRYVGILLTAADDNLIENCSVHDFLGRPGHDAQGIMLADDSNHNVIRDNEIYNNTNGIMFYIPNSGNPGDYDVSGNVIENNRLWVSPDVAPCAEQLIDIKVGSPLIRGNVMSGGRYNDGHCGGTGAAGAAALSIHGQLGDEVVVEDNTIFDSTCGMRLTDQSPTGTLFTIRRNLIYGQTRDESWCHSGIECQRGSYNIYNNTIANSPNHYAITVNFGDHIDIRNNLFYNTSRPKLYSAPASITADYNGYFSVPMSKLQPQFQGPHDTIGTDPLLTTDYRLTADSSARGAGENGVDLGAFPYTTQDTPTPGPEPTPTTTSPTATPTPAVTPTGQWWLYCTACPTYEFQPTLTPRPTPTCRPCSSPTPYPTATDYPPQPLGEIYLDLD